jgi:DNA-binding CsgD family transcriptional regulator
MSEQRGIPIAEAARRLGMSPDAVRMRIHRKRLPGYKVAGSWFVVLPEANSERTERTRAKTFESSANERTAAPPDPDMVALLERQIAILERELAQRNAELEARRESERELRILLAEQGRTVAELARRLPELSSGAPEATERRENPPHEPHLGFVYRVPEPVQRPWWKLWQRL